MEKFYFEEPSIKREKEAIEYINEFYKYNSNINGSGGLQRYLNNYNEWLKKLDEDYKRVPDNNNVSTRTYFLIRKNDNKIIGMLNLRLVLNEKLKNDSGNIGYSIRPTERKKGYNKINLFLGLLKAHEYGLKEVLLSADTDNPASWRTIEALGGVKINEKFSEKYNCIDKYYSINVNASINKFMEYYKNFISESN